MSKILYAEESYKIIGACFKVYKEMGPGFLEAVYQECLCKSFQQFGIPFEQQKELPLYFSGEKLNQTYRADFVCYDKIILEIKAVRELTDEHRAQPLNYLKATKLKLGLLINFSHYPNLQYERLLF